MRALAAGTALAALVAGRGQAQTLSTSAAQYNAGYGRSFGAENQPINPAGRDANGNRVIVDGVIQTGADQSVYAAGGAWGAGDAWAGAGALGGATAIGNNLVVVTQGSWNTVIVDSTQINNGDVTATAAASGSAASASAAAASLKSGGVRLQAAPAAPIDTVGGSTLGGGVGDLTGKVNLDDRP
jgi:holdfast attachment protein HfaA